MEIIIDLQKHLREIEKKFVLEALAKSQGNKTEASRLLCINRTTLCEKMKKHRITSLNPEQLLLQKTRLSLTNAINALEQIASTAPNEDTKQLADETLKGIRLYD